MSRIKEGDRIPEFTLKNQEGREVTISPAKGLSKIIYFYPKNNTKFCIEEACTFRDWKDDLLDNGYQIIGISSDLPSSHQGFSARHKLNFTLLSDPRSRIRRQFGAVYLFGIIPARYTYVVNNKGYVEFVYKGLFKGIEHVQEVQNWIKERKLI